MVKDLNMRAIIALGLVFAFLGNTIFCSSSLQAQEFVLPQPGVIVRLSLPFDPPVLRGIKVHPENPLKFDFILDQGDEYNSHPDIHNRHPERSEGSQQEQLKIETAKLVKYFLASLTIPEKDLWVNLSPYEKDRIIPQSFGLTEMGRDLLAEDYMLKQITASLIYPEDGTGKKFWKRIYEESAKKFGTTNIPVNTFNKVWIMPEKAIVYENAKAGTAYVVDSRLKVMLEQDYLALQKNISSLRGGEADEAISKRTINNDTNALGSQIVREILIPELTKEVNENKNFAQLRQVYNSLILATWYKKKIRDSILAQVYENKNKVTGVKPLASLRGAEGDAAISKRTTNSDVDFIYQRYLQAFKKGAYNYIKEEIDPLTEQVTPRKYFSGGLFMGDAAMNAATTVVDRIPNDITGSKKMEVSVDMAMIGPELPLLAYPEYGLKIGILRVEDIKATEDTDKGKLHTMRNLFALHDVIPTCITVMKGENGQWILLDGNHRLSDFKEMGYEYIPAFIVDEKNIKIGAWDRSVAITNIDALHKLFKEYKIVEDLTDEKERVFYYSGKKYSFVDTESMSSLEFYERVDKFFDELKKQEKNIKGIIASSADADSDTLLPWRLVVKMPSLTQKIIADAVSNGEKLPYKSFRTIYLNNLFPIVMPMRVSYFKELHSEQQLAEGLKILKEEMSEYKIVHLPQDIYVERNDGLNFLGNSILLRKISNDNKPGIILNAPIISDLNPEHLQVTRHHDFILKEGESSIGAHAATLLVYTMLGVRVELEKRQPQELTITLTGPATVDYARLFKIYGQLIKELKPSASVLENDIEEIQKAKIALVNTSDNAMKVTDKKVDDQFIEDQIKKLEDNFNPEKGIKWTKKVKYSIENEKKARYSIEQTRNMLEEFIKAVNDNEPLLNRKDKILKAIELVFDKQGQQLRPDGKFYPIHPLKVALIIIKTFGITDPDEVIVALLHDIIEDVDEYKNNHDLIGEMFGPEVQARIESVTNKKLSKDAKEWLTKKIFATAGVSREGNEDAFKAIMKIIEYQVDLIQKFVNGGTETKLLKAADLNDKGGILDNEFKFELASKYSNAMPIVIEELRNLANEEEKNGENERADAIRRMADLFERVHKRWVSELSGKWEYIGLLNSVMDVINNDHGGLRGLSKKMQKDFAMNSPVKQNGGIDLSFRKNDLEIKDSDGGIKLHIDAAMLALLQNASGFVPVIINIQPVVDIRVFLGTNS